MDFGVVVSNNKQPSPTTEPRDENRHGSANLKHQRSEFADDSWRLPKMPKPGDELDSTTESFAAFGRSTLWPSPADDGQKMLSFSSAEPRGGDGGGGGGGSSRSIAFSICQDEHHSRTGGGGLNGGVRGPFARLKGPFTPSQWMELEHQALIYKHIVANVPVPSNLLVPLKRSLYAYGSYASNLLGWGPFHLGYSGSNDPEPGRCRRTDGKKWRCSRDSVPDQKYCERHINRGRHRSRKPVEGQNNGHAIVSGSSSTTSLSLSKLPSIPSSSLSSPSLVHHPFSSMQQPNSAAAASAATDHLITRSQGFQGGLSLIPPSTTGPKSKDGPPFLNQSQQQQHNVPPFVGPSQSEFGFVSSHSLLNPSEERIFSYMNTTTNNNTTTTTTTDSFLPYDPNLESNNNNQHSSSVHHFMDDWPKAAHQSNRAPVSWPEELKSDWTQLSMSIPMPASSQERSTEPAHGLDPIHMGLDLGDRTHMGRDLGPVNWGNAMGGPLGEVLTSTGGAGAGDTFSSGKAGWRNSGTREIGSSPTGVLQKSTFVSLSNSSSGSSPPLSAENKKVHESSILCNDLLGSALASSAAIQSL
ncbi:hypothetical protein ABFS83_08G060600 [Erythranthe nasuta]